MLSASELQLLPGQLRTAFIWERVSLDAVTYCGADGHSMFFIPVKGQKRLSFPLDALHFIEGWGAAGVGGQGSHRKKINVPMARCSDDICSRVIPPNPHNSPLTRGPAIISSSFDEG